MFKLNFKSSSFDNIICYETINMETLDKLLNSDLLRKDFSDKHRNTIYENEKQQLIEYKKQYSETMKKIKVKYTKSKGKNYGRVLPIKSLGLHNIRREIRQTLAKPYYVDIDMESAHHVILNQVSKQNNIQTPQLEYYINNRDKILQEVMHEYSVGREEAKNLFIVILYGGSFTTWKNKYNVNIELKANETIKNLDKELKYISSLITRDNEIIQNDVRENNKKNIKSSVMSFYLQELECQILQNIYNYCVENGYIINNDCVLCADGIMIKKDLFKNELLYELENNIKANTGFNIKLKVKEMNEDYIDILDNHIINNQSFELTKINKTKSEYIKDNKLKYIKFKENFEKTHCKIVSKSFYICDEDNKINTFTQKKLIESYNDLVYGYEIIEDKINGCFIEDKDKPLYFIHQWIKDPNKRKYKDMGTYPPPLICPSNIYNTWLPFDIELNKDDFEYKEDNLNIILNHIKILCNNEDIVSDYLLKWISHMVKYPAVKIGIVPWLISKEGAGKNTLFKLIEQIIGNDKYLETSTPEDEVWGKFNSIMMNKYFIFITEIGKQNQEKAEGKIKALITDKWLKIEQKGKDAINIESYHRFIVATNKTDPTYTDKNDRRKMIIRSSDELIGNKQYFDKLYKIINDEDSIKTFYNYLLKLDVKDLHLKQPPLTEYHKTISRENVCPVKEFLRYFSLTNNQDYIDIDNKDLYIQYKDFINDNGYEYALKCPQFIKKLYSTFTFNFMEEGRTKASRYKHINLSRVRQEFKKEEQEQEGDYMDFID